MSHLLVFLAPTFTFDGTNFLSRNNARAGDAVASEALPSSKEPIFSTIRRKEGGEERGEGKREKGEGKEEMKRTWILVCTHKVTH